MQDETKSMFRLHAVVSLVLGVPLLIAPGEFLGAFGWAPVDPIITRLAGAAILAFGWSSFRAQSSDSDEIPIFILEIEAVFSVIGALAVLRHLLASSYPFIVQLTFAIFAVFGVAWTVFLLREKNFFR